jgi:hypothetical protein
MAICTRHSFLHIYKPLLLLALEEYFRAPVVETLASLYDALNAMDLSLCPRLSLWENFVLHATDAKDMFVEKFALMVKQRKKIDAERNSLETSSDPLKRRRRRLCPEIPTNLSPRSTTMAYRCLSRFPLLSVRRPSATSL